MWRNDISEENINIMKMATQISMKYFEIMANENDSSKAYMAT
jgi:hypothetical protein